MAGPEGNLNQSGPKGQGEGADLGQEIQVDGPGSPDAWSGARDSAWTKEAKQGETDPNKGKGASSSDKSTDYRAEQDKQGMRALSPEEQAALGRRAAQIQLPGKDTRAEQVSRTTPDPEIKEKLNAPQPLTEKQKEAVNKLFNDYLKMPQDAPAEQLIKALEGLSKERLTEFNDKLNAVIATIGNGPGRTPEEHRGP